MAIVVAAVAGKNGKNRRNKTDTELFQSNFAFQKLERRWDATIALPCEPDLRLDQGDTTLLPCINETDVLLKFSQLTHFGFCAFSNVNIELKDQLTRRVLYRNTKDAWEN